jgi:hypothetical protein
MPIESLKKLYDGVSAKYNIGDFKTFSNKMQSADSRRKFYDQVSPKLDIGDFDSFEAKVSTQAPAVKPNDVFIGSQYSFTAAPKPLSKPKIISTEYSKPLPFFNQTPEVLLLQPGGKKILQEYGYIVQDMDFQKSNKQKTREIAQAQNMQFLKSEISKEKEKGLSEREAFQKVYSDIGASLPNVVDLAMEQSITGSLFRGLGLNQTVDISNYPYNKMEELASGAIAMVMPIDAALFSFGGQAGQMKQVGKYADKAATLMSKQFNIPIGQARVLSKNALGRITGGAGGFAAFDGGRSIAEQIESTGKVNPIQVIEHIMKGAVLGGSVSSLGLAGSYFGKPVEFTAEVFGLGTVSPLLEGEAITKQGYIDAAATIIGLKFLKTFSPKQAEQMTTSLASEIQKQVETSTRPMHEVANKIGKRLRTSVELAIEGKTIEKTSSGAPIILGEQKAISSEIKSIKPEKVQLNEDIKRISENMDVLEKASGEQRILDDLQVQIDAKVKRLNDIQTEQIIIESQPRQIEPNPMLEVPLHPADIGRRTVKAIEKRLKTVDLLAGQKKAVGIELQKKYSDLDATLQSNRSRLETENLTATQRDRLKKSEQKIKELKRNTKERAESQGIEMQIFLGIPSPRILKQLFGSNKHKPTKYSDSEINRLYTNAMSRLDKETPKDQVRLKTTLTDIPVKRPSWLSDKLSLFNGDMVERVENMNTPTSLEVAKLARQAINIQKRTHGELSKELDIALKASGSGQASQNLARFVEVNINGQTVLMSRLHAAIEGLITVKGSELSLIEKHRDLIEKRGRIFEENGIMQEQKNGEIQPFKVMGRNIAPRIMTGDFYRLLETGQYSPEFKQLVSEFSKATGHSKENVEKYFGELQVNIKGDNPETMTRTTQAEHSRKWKNIPHAIKVNGEIIPIVEYRPYEYAKRLADTGESRIGIANIFGQELAGTSIVNQAKKQIAKEGGDPKKFHDLIRALSGAPVETSFMDSGFTGSKIVRGVKGVYNVIKQSSLSASLIPNVPEILGNVRRFAGAPTMLKSIFKLTKNPKAVNDALEQLGSITVDIANLSVDPNRPVSSRVRAINETQRRVFLYKYINEFQEKLSAQVAFDKVERFKQKKGTGKDVIFLREMGFSRSEAELMAKGNAPQELYNALIRRAPAHLTGGAQRSGEQSRLEMSRIFNTTTAFQTYAQMKIRSLNRVIKTNQKIINEAVNEKDYRKLINASRAITNELFGSAISGASAQFLLAYMYGGKDNVEIKWNEVKENPLDFIIKSWAYTTFAGVYGSIIQSTSEGTILDNPTELFYPIVLLQEVEQSINAKGKYSYLDSMDRFTKFTERFFPANRVAKQMLAATGFGNKQVHKDDNAIKAYYRWRFTNKFGGTYISNPDEELTQFRTNMKKAYKAIRAGDDPSIVSDWTLKAINNTSKDAQSIATSIRGRQLLTKSKIAPGKTDNIYSERLEKLRKTIGDNAFKRLQLHDELLKTWASAYK